MKRRAFLATLLATLASGCALVEVHDEVEPVTGELGPALDRFSISGRLALRQGSRRDHLRFDWQHGPEADTLLLMSPLGQGLAEIVRDVAGARMLRPNQPVIEATDLESLSQQIFGIRLPLQDLGDWLRGARGSSGELAGWRLRVTEATPYRQSREGDSLQARRLPRRLEVFQADVALTLIVDDWGTEP